MFFSGQSYLWEVEHNSTNELAVELKTEDKYEFTQLYLNTPEINGITFSWRRGGLKVNALLSGSSTTSFPGSLILQKMRDPGNEVGSSSLGSSPGRGHCVVLGKTLYYHSASLHSGVQMGAGELDAGGNPALD